ncbi:XRE family transcriptional regulator [Slackia isoflavoniconvertens]|uniref:LexA family protein n=1 Tax=Slackia isoflavoniconvertens TaxID=572010 RepID=UPI002E77E20C|nr:XRE family transcriptional regulator [Slackia isoflavoniconvertens]
MGLAENIRKFRTDADLTQAKLADLVGVTRATVTQWETGWSQPRMGAVEKLSEVLGVSMSELVDDSNIKRVPGAITPTEPRKAYLPLLGKVHAGDAQEPQVFDERISLPYEVWERHRDGYFLQVEGQCMSKIYPEGSYILIDPMQRPTNDSIAVVSIDGADYVMRRLYKGSSVLVLSPDSWEEGYDDIVIAGDDHTVEFVGSVVWFQASGELE